MTTTQRNVLANFAGQAVTMLCSLLFLPLYLPLLGTEAYGLVGFHAALATFFALLDAGLGAAASREAAQRASLPERAPTIGGLLRTLEWIYWPVAAASAAACWWVSPWLATRWLHLEQLSPETATNCLRLLGLVLAFRLPSGLYTGVLTGLHRQVSQNVLRIAAAILAAPGGFLLLKYVSRRPEIYFLWQAVVVALSVGIAAILAWRALPTRLRSSCGRPAGVGFVLAELRGVAQFAVGSSAIAVLSLVLTQTDRFLLSVMLPLTSLGIYTVALSLNNCLMGVLANVTSALVPRFYELEALGKPAASASLLHRATQALGLLLLPLAGLLITQMDDFLSLWLRDSTLLAAAAPARWLVAGSVFYGYYTLPYLLVLSKGNTRFGLVQNLIAISLNIPLLYALIQMFGITGAAMGSLTLTLGYYLISSQYVFRGTLPTEKNRWLLRDTALPLGACAMIFLLAKLLGWPATTMPLPIRLLAGGITYLLALIAVAIVSPEIRASMLGTLAPWRQGPVRLPFIHGARRRKGGPRQDAAKEPAADGVTANRS